MEQAQPRVWSPTPKLDQIFEHLKGNKFAAVNLPTSGPRSEKELPVGKSKLQLYSLATPNGMKPGIYLEELGVDYDAHTIDIGASSLDQFTSGFVSVNPNSKIPALVDLDGYDGEKTSVFESAAIIYYLAEKYNKFYPESPKLRNEIRQWIFWQMAGQGPMTGNFGHFFVYAPDDQVEARNYGVARYGMETKRLCHVLETRLTGRTYLVGEEYTIADIVCFPWFYTLTKSYNHKSGVKAVDFLSIREDYPNTLAWANRILERPAVKRGITVCSFSGPPKPWLVSNGEEHKL
jgi:GST-like protein